MAILGPESNVRCMLPCPKSVKYSNTRDYCPDLYNVPWELILQSIQSGISLRRWKFIAWSFVDSAESWIIGYCTKPSRMNRLTSILPVLVIQSVVKPKKIIILFRNWIGKDKLLLNSSRILLTSASLTKFWLKFLKHIRDKIQQKKMSILSKQNNLPFV